MYFKALLEGVVREKFPLEESFLCRQHCTSLFFIPFLLRYPVEPGGHHDVVDAHHPEIGLKDAPPPPPRQLMCQSRRAICLVDDLPLNFRRLFREGEAISLFSGIHGT